MLSKLKALSGMGGAAGMDPRAMMGGGGMPGMGKAPAKPTFKSKFKQRKKRR
jgi:hypothetical protein